MTENKIEAYDFDAELPENEPGGRELLPPGEYVFHVKNYERTTTTKGKMAEQAGRPVNGVKVMLDIEGPDGQQGGSIENFYLVSNMVWKIKAFFRSIGFDAQDGASFRPEWNKIIGCDGRAKFKQRTYQDKTYNEVDRYIDKPAALADASDADF